MSLSAGTHAYTKQEAIERKMGIFNADKGPINEGVFADDSATQPASTTVKNINGHKNPHLLNTPYTNDVASKVPEAQNTSAYQTKRAPPEMTAAEAFEASLKQ